MNANAKLIEEKKNKNKGVKISVVFHATLILLALLPFMRPDQKETKDIAQVIVMDFTNFDSASKKSAKGVNSTEKSAPKESTPEPVIEKEPQKPEVSPVPEPTPILTTPDPETPVKVKPVETKPTKVRKPRTKPVKVRKPKRKPTKRKPTTTTTETKSEEAPTTTETSKNNGDSDNDGKESGGDAESGDDMGDGNAGEGDNGMDFSGDGIFGRRVVYRAIDEVKKTVEEEGKIVINLCVSQEGRVIFAEYNEDESTITDKSIVRRTEIAVKKYRFAKDYTAPNKQCGKLSINFSIDN